MKRIIFLIVAAGILNTVQTFGQKTTINKSPENIYRQGSEFFHKELYSAAFDRFMRVTEMLDDKESVMYAECRYHMAVCAYELLNLDAMYRLESFIEEYPENTRKESALFYIANIHYRDKKYKQAVEQYALVDPILLEQEDKLEYYFKYGYSAFMMNDFDLAKSNLILVKDSESIYSPAATYYFAHIAYTEKNYATALEHFSKLTEDENFGPIVPYYITQIYYFQKKYPELIAFAEPFINNATTKRLPEIARLLGESYFNLGQFDKAVEYFEKYKSTTSDRLTAEDHYKLGYAYYRINNYEKAIPVFQNATSGNETIAQNANYHLGDCYIKTNNKPFARNAFYQAYKINKNSTISEDALFHFAKLSYELAINPYNEAIKALLEYVNTYPDNFRVDEAYEYLINLYMQTRNYKEALISIEQIKRPNEKLNIAYQKIAYYRGVELFNDRKYTDAITVFNKSIAFPYDRHLRSQSIFWIGEAYYRINNLDSALISFERFLQSPGAISSEQYALAFYNIGYCHFNKKEYEKALSSFRTFQDKYSVKNDALAYDAYIRTGDCFYATNRFAEAAIQYDKAVKPGVAYADYALFQRGNSKGVQGKFNEKIEDLELFLKSYPKSTYYTDVLYELAFTYEIIDKNQDAIRYYKTIIENHQNSTYHLRAMKQLGMIYYNTDQYQLALVELKKVIQMYPGTKESSEVLVVISNIYSEMGQPEGFFQYAQELGMTVAAVEQDSITYTAAENLYFKEDCVGAVSGFEKYILNFPNGLFILKAHFYKAECDYFDQRYDRALVGYEFVIGKPWSKFTEKSLLNAARIHFSKENYVKAAQYFTSLEEKAEFQDNILIARQGVMRSYFKEKQYRQAIISAQKVIDTPKANEENIVEARSVIGVSAYHVEDFALSQQEFEKQKILKSEYGAEAYYYLALINYTIGKYQESEKLIFELLNNLPSYEYWVAKSFLLLADNYVATGSFYQAKHTLKNLIDNYSGVDIVMEAQKKLDEIIEMENAGENETENVNE